MKITKPVSPLLKPKTSATQKAIAAPLNKDISSTRTSIARPTTLMTQMYPKTSSKPKKAPEKGRIYK